MITNRGIGGKDDRETGHRVYYARNRQPAECIDCHRTLNPGEARIWFRGKHRPWGAACRVKAMCLPAPAATIIPTEELDPLGLGEEYVGHA